ncbi:MAG TPA: Zn-ribbon domain-containing OB-fold protein [Streptosporangiaceae bacterium]|jgi:hypothetical protein|nr:Zn-ribbon domain-containing OB-fold protein [Streptosporangiaceae bacterium]
MTDKPVPVPTPETQPFWDGCAAGELRIQRCTDCGKPYFYPRPVCPDCGSKNVEWFTASGRATLYSYVINHRPAPGFADDGPYAIAVVQLEEGPRMMTNIIELPATPEALVLDMPLQITFEPRGHVSLPQFKPAGLEPSETGTGTEAAR